MSFNLRTLLFGIIAVPATVALIAACGSDNYVFEAKQGIVLQNVTVVNTRDGSLLAGQSIAIDNGKIVKIAAAAAVRASGTAQAIDATGKYVIPGLLDMHAHAMVHIDEQPSYFPLMIANGITGFREMGVFPGQFAEMVQRAHTLNADIAAGRIDAPEALAVPSDIFAGVTSAALATQNVTAQKAKGVDFIKVISASRDAMLAFLSEAKNQGLAVAGHLSPSVSATESSQAGWKTIEHLGSGIGILLDCAADETAMRASILAAAGTNAPAFPSDLASLQRVVSTHSGDKCQALAKVFVQNNTWQVPTLRRVHALEAADTPAFLSDPNLVYVDKARLATWNQLELNFAKLSDATRTAYRQVFGLQQAVTKMMKQSGVKMLAGSDSGVASVWVIPGVGLHEEFHELAAAGLSPLEILQMSTLNGAEFLNRQSTMGTVEEGKLADLVLLDANPIDDVSNLDKIAGVLLRGRYLAKEALAKMKSDTAAAFKNAPAPAAPPVLGTGHID